MAVEQAKQFIDQAIQSLQGGQVFQALELADQAIAQDPTSAEAYILCGVALSQSNQPQAACEAFDSAIDLDPENPKAFYNYAVHLYAMGDKAGALRMANHATVVDPSHVAAKEMVSRIEVESGIRVEDQAPVVTPTRSPADYREGYDERVHTIPMLQSFGSGWVMFGGFLAFASLINFGAAVIGITSHGLGDTAHLANAISSSFGSPISVILFVLSAAWTIMDVMDQRGDFLWVVVQILCGLFSGSFISLSLYIFTGRQKT